MRAAILAALIVGPGGEGPVPLSPGTVTIVPGDTETGAADEDAPFVDAVGRALLDAGFLPLPRGGGSRYIATVFVRRQSRGSVAAAASASRAGAHVGGWGAQVMVPLPSHKTQVRGLVMTELTVHLTRRADARPVWSGSALTVQVEGTRADAPDVIAAKLAPVVIHNFPAQATEPVSVP